MGANISTTIQDFESNLSQEVQNSCKTTALCENMITGNNLTATCEGNWKGDCLVIDQKCQTGAKCNMTVVATAAASTLQKATTQQKKTLTQLGLNISTNVQKQVQNIKQFFQNSCTSTSQSQNIIKNTKLNVTCRNGSGTCLRIIQFGDAQAACAVLTTLKTISQMHGETETKQTGSNALMWVLFGLGAIVIVGGIIYYASENRRRRRAGEQAMSMRQMLWARQQPRGQPMPQRAQQQPTTTTTMPKRTQPTMPQTRPAPTSTPMPVGVPVPQTSPNKTTVTVENNPTGSQQLPFASSYSAFYEGQGW